MTPLLVNFDPLLELVYSWPLYEVIFDYLFLSVYEGCLEPSSKQSGSKMNWACTRWLKVNPGNFEQFFGRWSKNALWLISVQNRKQIWRKSTFEMTESQNSQFVLNTKFQRQPVKLSEDGCNMLTLPLFSDIGFDKNIS